MTNEACVAAELLDFLEEVKIFRMGNTLFIGAGPTGEDRAEWMQSVEPALASSVVTWEKRRRELVKAARRALVSSPDMPSLPLSHDAGGGNG